MDQWWERHNTIDRGGYGQSDVEDVTGRIPLLLDKYMVSGKIDLTMADSREILSDALTNDMAVLWRWRLFV
jgi:hypothetical protein